MSAAQPDRSGKWSDLKPRVLSALAIAAVAASAVWAGGIAFCLFVALCSGLMIWELARMLDPQAGGQAILLGAAACAIICALSFLGLTAPAAVWIAAVLCIGAAGAGGAVMQGHKALFTLYGAGIMLAGLALLFLRDQFGALVVLWLLLVVIASDVAGYFAGKAFGGPKFWPRISPKKTWSGTVAGWGGAALIGALFCWVFPAGVLLVFASVALAFAAQMGDIAESAIKRRMNVKDSSALIPGHGGVLDRFDGILGAAIMAFLMAQAGLLI